MIQVIKYACCDKIFAACHEPHCYTDTDWLKNLKQYVRRGDKVEMIHGGNGLQMGQCECNELVKSKDLNLFSKATQ